MLALYALARGLLFPSEYESFGLPLVEAMACGCPVISSTDPACSEVVGDAAILVSPHDMDALSREMVRLGNDDALARDLSGRGLRRAADFSWHKSAVLLISELERAAAVYDEPRCNCLVHEHLTSRIILRSFGNLKRRQTWRPTAAG